jgi:type III restriction enzyme
MKLKFDSKLAFQIEAIQSITDIFEGQELCKTNFSVTKPSVQRDQLTTLEAELGVGNKLSLLDEELLENIQRIQLRNGLKQTTRLASRDFTVEMETGTGKTYVYLRTIFELNKQFGFTKFIIVVPSIAIKEGVNKSLQITKEHFKELYDNITYDFFTYDSQKLELVRSFATNDYIQIMVINIDAFRRSFTDPAKETKANIIHRYHDKLGYPPIELIRSTSPFVIIDEPQSVDNTPKSKEAIASLNPLCTLRYSATHREKYNLMYKLDSVDAYERKLVKQIEVASLEVENYHNKPYIKLLSVNNKTSPITAKVELDVNKNGNIQRISKQIRQNDDLMEITNRQIYEGYIIRDIYCEPENEYIDFTSRPEIVRLGHSIGTIDDDVYKRTQIQKTIEEHLNKELILNPQKIKVLSLFFIDKVSNYRLYDEEGIDVGGKYAHMFEEEYRGIIKNPRFRNIFNDIKDLDVYISQVHDGYFSIDKKGKAKDTRGDTQADDDTYNLIMKDKEKLLSFDSNLRFIFSHSALKEGWDNPNVFQICTLNETSSEMKKRQEIGRGLRLAVNQSGDRIQGFDVNTLTVMANESYDDFVSKLQKEIEQEEGIRFGYLEDHSFANVVVGLEGDNPEYLGHQKSEELWNFFLMKGYINDKGKVLDLLRLDLKEDEVDIPQEFLPVQGQIKKTLRKVAGKLNVKNAEDRRKINVNKGIFLSPEFKQLWNKIKYKTTYSVKFDTDKLIEGCAKDIRDNLIAGKGKFIYTKAKTEISRGGTSATDITHSTSLITDPAQELPDIVSHLQNETNLTRKSIVEILLKSKRLDAFKNNPQKFIDETISVIRTQMRHTIVDGIKYEKIGDHEIYKQELFENEELYGHLRHDMIESSKSPYNYVVYDSAVEKTMAEEFEHSDNVKVYAKLPRWFKINTPLGSYNPDWAILWEMDGEEKLFFVIETKGAISWEFLRPIEKGKIQCGKRHFQSLGEDIKLEVANNFDSLRDIIS